MKRVSPRQEDVEIEGDKGFGDGEKFAKEEGYKELVVNRTTEV